MAEQRGQWQIAYDKESQSLTITFPNGMPYTFEAVPPDIAEKFQAADNKGQFYNSYIRGSY